MRATARAIRRLGQLAVLVSLVFGAALTGTTPSRAAQNCQLPDRFSGLGQSVSYDGASLGFDGTFLDYTENATFKSGTSNGAAVTAAYNRVYTIDPATCDWRNTPTYHIPASLTGGNEVPLYQVTYDPKYQFGNGDLGAILARTGSGLAIGRLGGTDAAVIAIDPVNGLSELAFSVPCQGSGNDCSAEPSLFTYDYFRDRIWVSIPTQSQDQSAPPFIPRLVAVPAQRGAPATVDTSPPCFESGTVTTNFATWAVGGSDTLYVQEEDDQTVRHISSQTCSDVGPSFPHNKYGEASATENDQMVCDSVTYGQGPGGNSVLWLRDISPAHSVQAYDIQGACPFPTSLDLTPRTITRAANQAVPVCAVLRKFSNGRPPLAGMTLSFEVNNRSVGTAVTDAGGTGCVSFQAPPFSENVPVVARFAGTGALLLSQDRGNLVVVGPTTPVTAAAVPPPGGAVPRSAPPPAAPVQQLSVGPQVQAQSQVQAQTQIQLQPGIAIEQEQQVQLTVQGLGGQKRSGTLNAVSREPSPVVVLTIQLVAAVAMGAALLHRDRVLRLRDRLRPAHGRLRS